MNCTLRGQLLSGRLPNDLFWLPPCYFFRCCVHSLLERRVVTNEIGWIFYSALGVFSIFYCRPDCDNAMANFNQWSGLGPVVAAPTGFLSQMGAAMWRMVLDCRLFIVVDLTNSANPKNANSLNTKQVTARWHDVVTLALVPALVG